LETWKVVLQGKIISYSTHKKRTEKRKSNWKKEIELLANDQSKTISKKLRKKNA